MHCELTIGAYLPTILAKNPVSSGDPPSFFSEVMGLEAGGEAESASTCMQERGRRRIRDRVNEMGMSGKRRKKRDSGTKVKRKKKSEKGDMGG